eukprot:Amastigsp_a842066_42.p2 type:complete len:281 gc:universal Amastigsp_a842066_42:1081-239(-)
MTGRSRTACLRIPPSRCTRTTFTCKWWPSLSRPRTTSSSRRALWTSWRHRLFLFHAQTTRRLPTSTGASALLPATMSSTTRTRALLATRPYRRTRSRRTFATRRRRSRTFHTCTRAARSSSSTSRAWAICSPTLRYTRSTGSRSESATSDSTASAFSSGHTSARTSAKRFSSPCSSSRTTKWRRSARLSLWVTRSPRRRLCAATRGATLASSPSPSTPTLQSIRASARLFSQCRRSRAPRSLTRRRSPVSTSRSLRFSSQSSRPRSVRATAHPSVTCCFT